MKKMAGYTQFKTCPSCGKRFEYADFYEPETCGRSTCIKLAVKCDALENLRAFEQTRANANAIRIAEYEAQHEADLTLQVEQAARIVELERQDEMLRENVAEQRGKCVRLYSKLSAAREALND